MSDLRAPSVRLLGLEFAALSESATVQRVLGGVQAEHGGWVCPVNLDVLRQWRASEEVRDLVSQAELVVADGMPLVWAGGLQGTPLPQRVAGSSLTLTLSAAAAEARASIFLLGGNPGTAERAAEVLCERYPGLTVAGTLSPPFGFEHDPAWQARIERALLVADPDIVYVGLGFPKQERLIVALRRALPTTWFVSCGVSFSFIGGELVRAPRLMQRLGLEWLHRLVQEPRRLYRRYLLDGLPFLATLLLSVLRLRLHGGRT